MPDKKLTDNLSNNSPILSNGLSDSEIVKALKCCNKNDCRECPYGKYNTTGWCCMPKVRKDALDLINRLQEDKDDLERIVGLMNKRKYYRKFVDEVYRKEKGNKLSDPDFDYIYELYFKIQAENERLKKGWKADAIRWIIADAKAEAYKEFAERLIFKFNNITYSQPCEDVINNLLKELVGNNDES